MKNNNLTTTLNTTITPVDLCTPAAPAIHIPPCFFAGGRCWQCGHYSAQYCYKHHCTVDPEKWSCAYFE